MEVTFLFYIILYSLIKMYLHFEIQMSPWLVNRSDFVAASLSGFHTNLTKDPKADTETIRWTKELYWISWCVWVQRWVCDWRVKHGDIFGEWGTGEAENQEWVATSLQGGETDRNRCNYRLKMAPQRLEYLRNTHTQIYMYVCVCVCVYVWLLL